MRSFLDLVDVAPGEIFEILTLSRRGGRVFSEGDSVALVFEKPSLRTRNSCEVAVKRLGGHPVYIQNSEVGIDTRESAEDISRTLSTYHRLIAARVFRHSVLERMVAATDGIGRSLPIVNLLSDKSHPCQAIADLLTISDILGLANSFKGVKIAYVGDSNNVAFSLAIAALKVGALVSIASPEEYSFDKSSRDLLSSLGEVSFTTSPTTAVSGASVVYSDTWISMGEEAEADERRSIFSPIYQVDDKLMASANSNAIFMHCLPAHRGEEVTSEVFEANAKTIFAQAGNRLDAFQGVLRYCFA
ncbi:MAG: ornithine carbamoyltransferase [Actinomycetota bacterium]|nr:ornithine carbamoyltransferase [Actinomycetota bacterium]